MTGSADSNLSQIAAQAAAAAQAVGSAMAEASAKATRGNELLITSLEKLTAKMRQPALTPKEGFGVLMPAAIGDKMFKDQKKTYESMTKILVDRYNKYGSANIEPPSGTLIGSELVNKFSNRIAALVEMQSKDAGMFEIGMRNPVNKAYEHIASKYNEDLRYFFNSVAETKGALGDSLKASFDRMRGLMPTDSQGNIKELTARQRKWLEANNKIELAMYEGRKAMIEKLSVGGTGKVFDGKAFAAMVDKDMASTRATMKDYNRWKGEMSAVMAEATIGLSKEDRTRILARFGMSEGKGPGDYKFGKGAAEQFKDYRRSQAEARAYSEIQAIAGQGARGDLKEVNASLDTMGYRLITISYMTSKVATAFGMFSKSAVAASLDMGTSLGKIQGLLEGSFASSEAEIKRIREAIIDVSMETGESFGTLAAGAYDIVSAFPEATNKVELFSTAARLAKAGVANTTDALRALVPIAKVFGNESSTMVMNLADMAAVSVKAGVIELPELASGVEKVATTAKAAGVSVNEMFAALSSTAGVAGNPTIASTQFRALLNSLMSPGAKNPLNAMYAKSGGSFQSFMKEKGGLIEALQAIQKEVSETGGRLADFIPESRAATQFRAIIDVARQYNETLDKTKNSIGEMREMLAKSMYGQAYWATEVQKSQNAINVSMSKFGDSIAPMTTGVLKAGATILDAFTKVGGEITFVAGTAALGTTALLGFGGGIAQLGSSLFSLFNVSKAAMLGMFGTVSLVILGLTAMTTAVIKLSGEAEKAAKQKAFEYADTFYKGNPGEGLSNINDINNMTYSGGKAEAANALMKKMLAEKAHAEDWAKRGSSRLIYGDTPLDNTFKNAVEAKERIKVLDEAIARLNGTLSDFPPDPWQRVRQKEAENRAKDKEAADLWQKELTKMSQKWQELKLKKSQADSGAIPDFNFNSEQDSTFSGFYDTARQFSAEYGLKLSDLTRDIFENVSNRGVQESRAILEEMDRKLKEQMNAVIGVEGFDSLTPVADKMGVLRNAIIELSNATDAAAKGSMNQLIAKYRDLKALAAEEAFRGQIDAALKASRDRDAEFGRFADSTWAGDADVASKFLGISGGVLSDSNVKALEASVKRLTADSNLPGGIKPQEAALLDAIKSALQDDLDKRLNVGNKITDEWMSVFQQAGMGTDRWRGERYTKEEALRRIGVSANVGTVDAWLNHDAAASRDQRSEILTQKLSLASDSSDKLAIEIEQLNMELANPFKEAIYDLIESQVQLKSHLQRVAVAEEKKARDSAWLKSFAPSAANTDDILTGPLGGLLGGLRDMERGGTGLGVMAGNALGGGVVGGAIGDIIGGILGGPFGMLAAVIIELVSSSKALMAVLAPSTVIFKVMMDILGPVLDSVLTPLVGVFVVIGQLLAAFIVPILNAFAPVIKTLVEMFVMAYNFMLPVFEFFMDVISVVSGALAMIASALMTPIVLFALGLEALTNLFIKIGNDLNAPWEKDKAYVTFGTDLKDRQAKIAEYAKGTFDAFGTQTLQKIDLEGVTAAGASYLGGGSGAGGLDGGSASVSQIDQTFETNIYINGVDLVGSLDGKVVSVEYIVEQVKLALAEGSGVMASV